MLDLAHKAALLRNSIASLAYRPYSRIFIQSDQAGWVLDEETRELMALLRQLGVSSATGPIASWSRQCIHYSSQFALQNPSVLKSKNRFSFDYFHGMPGTEPVFTEVFEILKAHHPRVSKVRVSHSEIQRIVLSSGIDSAKVHRVPIGINLDLFTAQTPESKKSARSELGIPQSAVVIGSFQKDGNGWGEGNDPKPIKGPDVFLRTVEILKASIPELWVLLTGPARGYVKNGLDALGIPYTHRFLEKYSEINRYFQALDAYIVASRQEGGPKAVLESMATGVPLVTTRVGQAMDLVQNGKNALMVEVEDAEGLAAHTVAVLNSRQDREAMLRLGLQTAQENSYISQVPMWRNFFQGYVSER